MQPSVFPPFPDLTSVLLKLLGQHMFHIPAWIDLEITTGKRGGGGGHVPTADTASLDLLLLKEGEMSVNSSETVFMLV